MSKTNTTPADVRIETVGGDAKRSTFTGRAVPRTRIGFRVYFGAMAWGGVYKTREAAERAISKHFAIAS